MTDLSPETALALTGAAVLTLTSQGFTRELWADLSLHAPEADLRRLLRHALQNGEQTLPTHQDPV